VFVDVDDEFNFPPPASAASSTPAAASSTVLAPTRPPCGNCGVTESPLWRRDPDGNVVCNACGEFRVSFRGCLIFGRFPSRVIISLFFISRVLAIVLAAFVVCSWIL
jgi:hypothetical protein